MFFAKADVSTSPKKSGEEEGSHTGITLRNEDFFILRAKSPGG